MKESDFFSVLIIEIKIKIFLTYMLLAKVTWAISMIMPSYWVISTLNQKKKMSNFLNPYRLKNIVKQKTCFKNPDRPTCINLILTNFSRSFQGACTVETRLSDFYKLVATVLKLNFQIKNPIFKPSKAIKDSKILYLDRNLIMCYQNLMYATYNLSIFFTFLMKFWISTYVW